jgi:STE24 endopeptidase
MRRSHDTTSPALALLGGLAGALGQTRRTRPHLRRAAPEPVSALPNNAPPAAVDDAETGARAIRYTRTREMLFVVDLLWGWMVQCLFLASGGSARLRYVAQRWAPRPWAADALYTVLYSGLTLLINLPLSYIRGYAVEHRYGLSNQSHRAWLTDLGKGTALGLAFEVPLSVASYAVIRRSPRWWWLILSGLALPFTVLLAQLYPVLIAPIFNTFVPVADPDLERRVRALAERAGVRVAQVTQMDMSRQTRKANAFFAGLGPTKRIALGDTLVEQFTPDEVEVIVAHELGHQVHHDIWKGVAAGSLASLGGAFLLSRLAEPLARRFQARLGFAHIHDIASVPLLGLLLSVLSVLGMPLSNGFSRRAVERPADRYALDLTGHHDAFISSMRKLTRLNLVDPNPPRLVKLLLYSHPPIAERIAMAEAHRARAATTAEPTSHDR